MSPESAVGAVEGLASRGYARSLPPLWKNRARPEGTLHSSETAEAAELMKSAGLAKVRLWCRLVCFEPVDEQFLSRSSSP